MISFSEWGLVAFLWKRGVSRKLSVLSPNPEGSFLCLLLYCDDGVPIMDWFAVPFRLMRRGPKPHAQGIGNYKNGESDSLILLVDDSRIVSLRGGMVSR